MSSTSAKNGKDRETREGREKARALQAPQSEKPRSKSPTLSLWHKKKKNDASSAEDDESRSEGLSPIWGIQELDEKNFEQGISFVTTCINWLVLTEASKQTGLFRKAGNEEEIVALKNDMKKGVPPNYNFKEGTDPHTISSLLKRYFREIKNPLLTHQLYAEFIAATSEEDDKRIPAIKVVLAQLPDRNKQMLKLVCEYLHQVSKESQTNMMTPLNLGIVFAPNFLRPLVEKPSTLISDAGHAVALVQTFITEVETIFITCDQVKEEPEIRAALVRKYTLHRTRSKEVLKKCAVGKDTDHETFQTTLQTVGEKILEGEALFEIMNEKDDKGTEEPPKFDAATISANLAKFAGIRPNKKFNRPAKRVYSEQTPEPTVTFSTETS